MHESAPDVWFFYRDGQQSGALSFADLKEKADQGLLRPRHDFVWKEGMADWTPIGEIEGLLEPLPFLPSPPVAVEAVPAAEALIQLNPDQKPGIWPGTGRRVFIPALLILTALGGLIPTLVFSVVASSPNHAAAYPIIAGAELLIALLILYFVAQRLANLGMNRWWSVGFFIPLLKWWVGYRSIACPAGYEEHRKMDRPGMFLAITYWLLVVASVIAFLAILAIFNGTLGTADLQRHLQEAAGGLQK